MPSPSSGKRRGPSHGSQPAGARRQRSLRARGLRRSGFRKSAIERVLHVERLRRKAGTPLWRGPSPRRQLTLTLTPVAMVLLLLLAIYIGRRYTTQKLDIETSIRAQLVPALEKELGKKVEVGSIESDYFSRVILRDVVIGRDKTSPLGALLQAKAITLSVDAVTLVLHRDNPLLAISRVVLDSPQLDLRRDAQGQFNITKLLRRKKKGGSKWRGLVEASNGRVYYEDLFMRSARGRPLVADMSGVTGRARFNAADPVSYAATARSTLLGPARAPVPNVRVVGAAAANGTWLSLDADLPRAPAPIITEYAFRKGEVIAQSGSVGGHFRVMWDKALPRAAQFNVGGQALLQNVTGYSRETKEPGTNRPLLLQNVNGFVTFSDKSFETKGATLVALSTPVRAAGTFTMLPHPIFDLKLSSNAFNFSRLWEVFRRSSETAKTPSSRELAANLRNLQLRTGNAYGTVRVSGDRKNWTAQGAVGLPATSLSHPRWGTWNASTLTSRFDLQNQNGRFAIKTTLNAQGARGSQAQAGAWQASGTVAADVLYTNSVTPAPLQVRFSMPSASGRQNQLGAWRGDTVSGVLRTSSAKDAPIAVQLAVGKLAGRHPQFGIAGARGLRATINTARPSTQSTRSANFLVSATAQSATASHAQWGQFQSGALRVGGRSNAGNATFSINSQSTRARSARWGAAQLGNLQAIVSTSGPRLFARWNARNATLQNSQAGAWRAATLIGSANVRSTRGATPVSLDVEARDFSGRHARYGFWKGEALRATASSPNAARGDWSGLAAVGRTDASRANLVALSPSLAQQVRDVGTITGKARFTNLSPGSTEGAVVKGRARLSRVVVVQGRDRFALRDVETEVAFGGRQVRLSNLSAQSEYGVLQAEAQSDLRGGGLRFSILAPNVGLSATQINHYLAPSGVQVTGSPRVRLRISAVGSNDFQKEAPVVRANFNVILPRGTVRWTDRARGGSTPPQAARLQNAQLRGDGLLRFGGATNWRFAGNLALAATHAVQDETTASPVSQSPVSLRAAELRLIAQGSLERTAAGITPNFAGEARAQKLLLPLPDKSTRTGTTPFLLENARTEFVLTPRHWQFPRFQAEAGGESRIVGHASFRPQNNTQRISTSGQLLLEKFDASQARRVLLAMQGNATDNNQIPDVRGVLFARADFSGELQNGAMRDMEIGLQARLYNGLTRWWSIAGEINELPIDAARISTTISLPRRADEPITLEDAALWSEGGRLGVTGVLTPQGEGFALDLNANLHSLRIRRLLGLPSLRASLQRISDESDLDGLLSGEFKISGTTSEPRVEGRTALRLAQAFGFEIQNATGELDVHPQQTTDGLKTLYIGLTKIQGRITGAGVTESGVTESGADDGAPQPNFSGEFVADGAANDWHLVLDTGEITTGRLLLAAEQSGDTRTRGWRSLPLSGALSAGVNLRGTLRADDGSTQFLARTGEVSVQSVGAGRQLRWKGRDLGALTARLLLLNGVLQVKQFELVGAPDAEGDKHPLFQVSGVLPVSLDAPSLDAEVVIENQQLSFVIEVLREIREALQQRGQNVTYLNTVMRRIEGLPSTLDGNIDLRAHLDQSWRTPVVAVNSLRVNEMFFRTVSGTRKVLPDLQASFIYDGNDNGALAIRNAELRLPRDQSTPRSADDEEDGESELLIRTLQPGRIVPGGEMSLQAEILNADLEQLADWIPSLRNAQGQPIVKGRLTDFVIELSGTTGDPRLTGSMLGEDWELRQYSLDRVRLDKFTIANGELRIEPGFLTVVKGDFQSAAAWGFLPWSWGTDDTPIGPDSARPLEVHFPIGSENFGALAGIFVPAMQNVGADAFSGDLTVTGTLLAPRLAGEATVSNGRFRVRSTYAELDTGITNLNGTLRFVEGNRLEIGEGGLRGKLVAASEVKAPETGNEPSDARVARDARKKRDKGEEPNAPRLAGDFILAGSATLDLDPRALVSPRATLANHRYDLRLALAGGSYATSEISGVRDVNGAVLWQTGEGEPRTSQHLRWALNANAGEKNQGKIASFAALRLAPNFGESLEAMMHSRAEAFYGVEDFRALGAMWSTLPASAAAASAVQTVLQNADGAQGHIGFRDFQLDWEKVARGTINGNLLIDNGASTQPAVPLPFDVEAPPAPVTTAQAKTNSSTKTTNTTSASTASAITKTTKAARTSRASVSKTAQTADDVARVQKIQNAQTAPTPQEDTPRTRNNRASGQSALPPVTSESGDMTPLRFSGEIVLEEAELYGAPAELSRNRRREDDPRVIEVSNGVPVRGALSLPNAPVFDVRLRAGREVEFVSSNLRATITGELLATGTPRDPVLLGTLYTRGGQITFPNARARLISGELNIAARRDVSGAMRLRIEIDVTARGRSGRYEITIRLRGPLDTGEQSTQDLRVDVTSNPPLSSDEAFAQLLGTAVLNRGNLDDEGNENYARAIVGFLSGPLFSGIERTLEEALGLDTIALDYRIDEPIGIEIGKAIGDRLFITYRRALQSTAGEKTPFDLRIDYRIKGDIELGLETNERDERKLTIQKRWRF